MPSLEGDIEGGELVLGLGLVIVIGWALYKFSQSFKDTIDQVFGLSSGTAATAPAGYGGTYANAANQVVTSPLTSLATIVGLNQTQTPAAPTAGPVTDPVSGITVYPGADGTPTGTIGSAVTSGVGGGASAAW